MYRQSSPKRRSQEVEDILDDPDEKNSPLHQQKSINSESDNEKPPTDSETENNNTDNNGSRSPLLETRSRTTTMPKTKNEQKTSSSADNNNQESNMPAAEQETHELDMEGAVGGIDAFLVNNVPALNTKSEDSGCPSSDCEQGNL